MFNQLSTWSSGRCLFGAVPDAGPARGSKASEKDRFVGRMGEGECRSVNFMLLKEIYRGISKQTTNGGGSCWWRWSEKS